MRSLGPRRPATPNAGAPAATGTPAEPTRKGTRTMSINLKEVSAAIAACLSETHLEVEVLTNETKGEALAVNYGAWIACRLAFHAATPYLEPAKAERLSRKFEGIALALSDHATASGRAGHHTDALGAASGEFRGLANLLADRNGLPQSGDAA